MQLLHGSITTTCVVQPQKMHHLVLNSATDGASR